MIIGLKRDCPLNIRKINELYLEDLPGIEPGSTV